LSSWLIYTGTGEPHEGIARLPDPPPWRQFTGGPALPTPVGDTGNTHAARTYLPTPAAVEQVNASLYLRRPLLATGLPGTGKSTLAYAVAHELRLGPVLHWPITSRVTLRDGLYQYDPLTRLYAAGRGETQDAGADDDVGRYIRLGPLGTALLPYDQPRVLLIDEIDKSDIDLANDLLTIFEKGEFDIAEVARQENPYAEVLTADGSSRVRVGGVVRCRAFPLIIMTSNGEREFPPAFLRRCMTVTLTPPGNEEHLFKIVQAHLGELASRSDDLVARFFQRRSRGSLATDQLLNAVYLTHHATIAGIADRLSLADKIMPYLSESQSDVVGAEASDDG
jgi:MoxR-like ATPase